MFFKLIVLITFLFAASHAVEFGKDRSFSVEKEWKKSACTCKREPTWIGPVQKYYNDVIASFANFRYNGTNQAGVVKKTMKTLLHKLIECSNSQSEILSTGATVILEVFSQINIEVHSAEGIYNEFYRMLSILMSAYRSAATNLTPVIGNELVCAVNDDLRHLEGAFQLYIDKFNTGDGNGTKIVVDYTPVMERVQKLEDTIGLRGDITLSERKLARRRVQDALKVLNLVLDHVMICYSGLSSASESILLEQNFRVPARSLLTF